MKDDDVVRLIMMPIGLMSVYAVIKMNGHISKSFFPFPQIDKAVMFLWWIAPFVLGVLVIVGVIWISCRYYQKRQLEKIAVIEKFRKEFRNGIIEEVDQSLRYYKAEFEKVEKKLKERIYELESKSEKLSPSHINYEETSQDFIIEKFI